jgi:hypothetical protein
MKLGDGERLGDKGYPSPVWERKVTEAFTEAIAFLQSDKFLDSHCFADQPIQEAIHDYEELRHHYRFQREEENTNAGRKQPITANACGILDVFSNSGDVKDDVYWVTVARWKS